MVATFFFQILFDRLNTHQSSISIQTIEIESHEIDNFDLNELMDLAEAYVVPVIDAITEVVMLLAAPNEYLGA